MVGPLVWSIAAVLAGLVVLALLGVTLLRAADRTSTVLGAFRELVDDRGGLLRARMAALQVRMAQRRGEPAPGTPVQSGTTTGGASLRGERIDGRTT